MDSQATYEGGGSWAPTFWQRPLSRHGRRADGSQNAASLVMHSCLPHARVCESRQQSSGQFNALVPVSAASAACTATRARHTGLCFVQALR